MRRRVLPRERKAQVQVGWFLSTRYTRVLSKHATDTRSRVKCIHVHCACPSVNRVWTPHTHHAVSVIHFFLFCGPQPAFAHILNLTHPDRETLKCTLHIPNFLFFFVHFLLTPATTNFLSADCRRLCIVYYWAVSLLGTAPP